MVWTTTVITIYSVISLWLYVRSTAKVIHGREKLRKREKPAYGNRFVHNLYWERDFHLEKQNIKGKIAISASTNLVRCSILCSSEASCSIFSFNMTTKACVGFSEFSVAAVAQIDDLYAPQGYIYSHLQNDCYSKCNLKIEIHNKPRTYLEAADSCVTFGRRLAVLDSLKKQECVWSLKELSGRYWLGLSDRNSEGNWIWGNGQTFILYSSLFTRLFNNFDSTMSGSMMNDADCGLLMKNATHFADFNCEYYAGYICEKYQ